MAPDNAASVPRPGTAVVTGASSGIGASYARRLAAGGHDLVLVARRAQRLEQLADELGRAGAGAVELLPADLADAAGREPVLDRLRARTSRCWSTTPASTATGRSRRPSPPSSPRSSSSTSPRPRCLPGPRYPDTCRGRGGIINVASLLAFAGALPPGPLPHRAVYAGTKGFMVTFSRTLAAELAGTGVEVQVVCPGYTATEFHRAHGLEPVTDDAQDRIRVAAPAMAAEDVVRASLAALGTGEVVCVPGLADPAAVERLLEAEAGIRSGSGPALAPRYGG